MATLNSLFERMPGTNNQSVGEPDISSGPGENEYWKFQEQLGEPSLKKNPRYIEWKRKQLGGRNDDSMSVEPMPMT